MCIQPSPSIALARRRVVVPVAEHHAVAAGALLAGVAAGHGLAGGRVDDLDLDVRVRAPDRRDALLERVVDRGLRRDRRRLGHAAGDRDLGHVHVSADLLHHLDRAGRPGHDAGAQRREVELGEARLLERGDEHRRHAVERRAALAGDRLEHGEWIEGLAGTTTHAPWVTAPRFPITQPKQW